MSDESHLDLKYFISDKIYNCPFCNRRHVSYSVVSSNVFDWSNTKTCAIWRIKCDSCLKTSMHLTFKNLQDPKYGYANLRNDLDIDDSLFYSVPTSFFVVDSRIPAVIRELITEAEGCTKMNYLTGASACTRKAIYELLSLQKTEGENYDDKIKNLESKHPAVDKELFEILGHIKDMTSDHVHEQSWITWDSKHLELFLETLKNVLHEIYVIPEEKKHRVSKVRELRESLGKAKQKETSN